MTNNLIWAISVLKRRQMKLQHYEHPTTDDLAESAAIEVALYAMSKRVPAHPKDDGAFGCCPRCGLEFNSELVSEYELKYCLRCGQKVK